MALAVLTAVPAARGQTVVVAIPQENIRQPPQGATPGKLLGTVYEGTPLAVVGRRAQWRQVTLEGWIWSESVRTTARDGFDLVVAKRGGENLRALPNGPVLGRLLQGFLLERIGQQGGWTRVRRTAWIWGPSLGAPPPESAPETQTPTAEPQVAAEVDPGAPVSDRSTAADRSSTSSDRLAVPEGGAYLLVSPDGDTLGHLEPGADLRVLARQGTWARVRLDAWVWTPSFLTEEEQASTQHLGASDLRANPEAYNGRTVQWEVQFVSMEQADAVRTDFYEGEHFILARAPDASDGFVYLAVPPELVPVAAEFRPLQTIRVLARVRTGASSQMGAPILDLLAAE